MKKISKILSIMLVMILLMPTITDSRIVLTELHSLAVEPNISTTADSTQKQVLDDFVEPEYKSEFTMPDELKAITITPSVEFANGEADTDENILIEVNKLLDNVTSKGMNSVIINTNHEDRGFYTTDINETVKKTPVEIAVKAAKDKGFFVYLTFDVNFVLNQFVEETLGERIDYLALQARCFTVKYRVDGIILEGYYSSKNGTSFDDYMQNGSGIGFNNWLLDNGSYVFSLVSDAIRKTNNTVPVGIFLKDAWANYSKDNESGSKTADSFQALKDGYSDTLGYIKKGYADFIMLEAEGSRTDQILPFGEIVKWWGAHSVEANIPLYVQHNNQKICTDAAGWSSPDELVKQLNLAKSVEGYKGSAFKSYGSLMENKTSSTDALLKYYNDEYNFEVADNELNIITPKQNVFTTEEPMVKFMGTFDSNFDVYFNGELIKLNDAGNFYYEEELDVGLNTFTIQNKGRTLTYQITRKIQVLKSMQPSANVAVEEKTSIVISAIAYKGSVVSASVNGKNIPMSPVEGMVEGMENSNYVRYTATYETPKGIINKEQNLGRITVYGSYKGKNGTAFNENIPGGNITVNALPEIPNNADGQLLRVRNDNTQVFDYKTTGKIPTPNQARLPKGALDYHVKTVTYESTKYYITLSGKRLRASEVDVLDNSPIGVNNLSVASVEMDGTDTIIKISQNVKTPFSMSFGNVAFAGGGSYAVSSFTATSLTITFDYSNSASGDLNFPSNAIFSSGSWGQANIGGTDKQQLTLNLRNQGIFAGVSATYDDGGNLVFRFNGYRRSLSGATIVLDPGHGYANSNLPSTFDHGAIGHITDQSVGLALTKLLEEKFKAQGANVIRLNTESKLIDTYERASFARQYNPDIFISIHGNAGVSSARGVEAWYFTPFSQPLARSVSSSLAGYYKNSVYQDGVNRDRGAKYDYFAVTLQQEFASILLEAGFVTSYEEAMAMNNKTHQNGMADAIVQGCKNYLNR